MPRMRRIIALIIMLIVPLQFAWSAAAGLHGHMGMDAAGAQVHDHDHHHEAGHASHELAALGSADGEQHNEDGHHGSHCHHVFSFIFHQPGSLPGLELSGGPVQHAHAAFLTRIPPLLDRPPLARA
ncbi:MAG: hypothetical protein Q8K57_02570 [Thiobacillus sp.]|nr:hypothetical protein [Thiobacillus sp.]